MSKLITDEGKEKSKIFRTILSSPGMNERCKINLVITRQNILFLSRLIEAGLLTDNTLFEDEILTELSQESIDDFKVIHEEILRKGGLTEFYDRLKLL